MKQYVFGREYFRMGKSVIKKLSIIITLVLLYILLECGVSDVQNECNSHPSSQPVLTSMEVVSGEITKAKPSLSDTSDDGEVYDGVTPYQFLNLFVGNAEEIAFSYTVKLHETNRDEKGDFYQCGGKSVEIFSTQDMNELSVTVRMLEKNGFVHYIMDGTRHIKTYPLLTDNFLLNRMMGVVMSSHVEVMNEDGVMRYNYIVPFEQDESIEFGYVFYMWDGALIAMTYSVDGILSATYDFSVFEQRLGDKVLFELPDGYTQEIFDYAPDDRQIPPWWENDG